MIVQSRDAMNLTSKFETLSGRVGPLHKSSKKSGIPTAPAKLPLVNLSSRKGGTCGPHAKRPSHAVVILEHSQPQSSWPFHGAPGKAASDLLLGSCPRFVQRRP